MQYRDSHIAVPSRGQLSVLLLNSASSPGPEAQCAAPATSSVRRHIYYLATSTRTSLSIPEHRVEYSILFSPANLTHSPHCAVSELQLVSHGVDMSTEYPGNLDVANVSPANDYRK